MPLTSSLYRQKHTLPQIELPGFSRTPKKSVNFWCLSYQSDLERVRCSIIFDGLFTRRRLSAAVSSSAEQRALQALQQGRIAEARQLFASIAPSLRTRKSLFAAAVAFASGSRFAEALGMLQRLDGGQQPDVESLNLRADICVQMLVIAMRRQSTVNCCNAVKQTMLLHYKTAQALFGAGAVEPAPEVQRRRCGPRSADTDSAKLLKARVEAALGHLDQAQVQLEKLQKNGQLKDSPVPAGSARVASSAIMQKQKNC